MGHIDTTVRQLRTGDTLGGNMSEEDQQQYLHVIVDVVWVHHLSWDRNLATCKSSQYTQEANMLAASDTDTGVKYLEL